MSMPQMVEKATQEHLSAPDWQMNVTLCDIILAHPPSTKDAIKQVKARIKHKNPKVQLLALTLLETLVKNCASTHPIVSSKRFQNSMFKIATNKKTSAEVRNKLADQIQMFARSFTDTEFSEFEKTYINLKKSGITFPSEASASKPFPPPTLSPSSASTTSSPTHAQLPPMQKSSSSSSGGRLPNPVPVKSVSSSSSPSSSSSSSNPNQELFSSITSNVQLLLDMLYEIDPKTSNVKNNDIIQELVSSCKAHQSKVQTLIESGSDAHLDKLLKANDDLLNAITQYETVARGNKISRPKSSSPTKQSPTPTITVKPTTLLESLDGEDFMTAFRSTPIESGGSSSEKPTTTSTLSPSLYPTLGTSSSVQQRSAPPSPSPASYNTNALSTSSSFGATAPALGPPPEKITIRGRRKPAKNTDDFLQLNHNMKNLSVNSQSSTTANTDSFDDEFAAIAQRHVKNTTDTQQASHNSDNASSLTQDMFASFFTQSAASHTNTSITSNSPFDTSSTTTSAASPFQTPMPSQTAPQFGPSTLYPNPFSVPVPVPVPPSSQQLFVNPSYQQSPPNMYSNPFSSPQTTPSTTYPTPFYQQTATPSYPFLYSTTSPQNNPMASNAPSYNTNGASTSPFLLPESPQSNNPFSINAAVDNSNNTS